MDSYESTVGGFTVAPTFDEDQGHRGVADRGRPSLLYRSTARMNILVWKLPLPRRALVLLSRIVYRSPPMPAQVTVGVVNALQAADVHCWITGGWGVDALAGKPTRTHRDLDLVVDDRNLQRAIDVLEELGYSEWYRSEDDELMGTRIVLQDGELAGRVIDLHPVKLPDNRITVQSGALEGHPVPCLSLAWQLQAHEGYRARGHDRADFALLRQLKRRSASS